MKAKRYVIRTGTLIRRFNQANKEWEDFLTTKEASYVDSDGRILYSDPDVMQVTLPESAWPYTHVRFKLSDVILQ
jgi:hypothetical protein